MAAWSSGGDWSGGEGSHTRNSRSSSSRFQQEQKTPVRSQDFVHQAHDFHTGLFLNNVVQGLSTTTDEPSRVWELSQYDRRSTTYYENAGSTACKRRSPRKKKERRSKAIDSTTFDVCGCRVVVVRLFVEWMAFPGAHVRHILSLRNEAGRGGLAVRCRANHSFFAVNGKTEASVVSRVKCEEGTEFLDLVPSSAAS